MKYLIVLLCVGMPVSGFAGRIAITFDDAPTSDSVIMSSEKRTKKLIKTLKKSKVKQALFFVTIRNIQAGGTERLKNYTDSGHLLANHSHSHKSANKIPVDEYIADVIRAKGHL